MFSLNQLLTFDSQSAYGFAYDLTMNKNFSTPKIYTANGDLKKRWYVYFSFRNPNTGKLKRVTPFYGDAHKYKTKEERLYVLSVYRKKILELLKAGFNPFEDNTELYEKRKEAQQKQTLEPVQKITTVEIQKDENSSLQQNIATLQQPVATDNCVVDVLTVKEAFDFALKIKKTSVSDRTYKDYNSKINKFLDWLKKNTKVNTIDQLSKKVLQQYLNEVLHKTTPRNRNNYRLELSSLMQVLEDNEIVDTNHLKAIKVLKANPERNKTYSKNTQEKIFSYLEDKDPHLLLFIKFISYNFLRPIEVCRIQIKDINLEQRTITFKAKNKLSKIKIIPDILFNELPDLSEFNPEDYLFTQHQLGGQWDATENNKRDYFSKRFKRIVKKHFNLGKDYGLYSFRHTYITKLYRELRKTLTPYEAKSNLILITGHTSMSALEKYLRDIDAELPQDYSELLKV